MEPSPEAKYERARRFSNLAMRTIALQCRRLKSAEPEDDDWIFQREADFQFLIVALTRLLRAADLASKVESIKPHIKESIDEFDEALPGLREMRNTAEHIDEYAIDGGHNKNISRKKLEVVKITDTEFEWLGYRLDTMAALRASEVLFERIMSNSPVKTRLILSFSLGLNRTQFGV